MFDLVMQKSLPDRQEAGVGVFTVSKQRVSPKGLAMPFRGVCTIPVLADGTMNATS